MSVASTDWKEAQLGDHVDLLTGHPFKSTQYTDDPGDVRLLRGDNVGQGILRWDGAKRWRAGEYQDFTSFHVRRGDVILAMDRPWITAGLKYAWVRDEDLPALLVQRVARLRGTNGLLTDYVRCLIGSPAFTNHVQSITTGVNVPHISGKDIKAFRFRLPPIPIQDRIASIITTYDDLIENNTRRIAILEEMARRLYEEWFVHFRFPGHEEATLVETEQGSVPKEWEITRLDNVATVNPDSIKPRIAPESINYIDIASVSPGRVDKIQPITFRDAPGRARRKVQSGDILWSCVRPNRRSHALILSPEEDTVASTGFAVLRADAVPYSYLYQAVTADAFVNYLVNHATGAAYPAVKQSDFEAAEIAGPPERLLWMFNDVVEPMLLSTHTFHRKNANLRAQRDLLLPKLVSGEIDATRAQKELEAAA